MSTCHYDRDAEAYIQPDGEPCRTDEYGDPTHHCTSRRTCSQHVGDRELTCARCLGRTRTDIRQIVERAALMLPEALEAGVDSEAANLAGPAADYGVFSARRMIAKKWIQDHLPARHQERAMRNLLPNNDEWHPYSVLTRWAMMLAEDYGLTLPDRLTVSNAAATLEAVLHRVAQDDEQDFPLLAREMRKCRAHLESVMRDSQTPERGAFCPTCKKATPPALVRLTREYPHYCENPECCQVHVTTDELDVWVCPRNREHWWNPAGYTNVLKERKEHSECA